MISRQYVLHVELERDAVPSFEAYPFNLPAVRHLEMLELHPQVTFFVGENGSGKSTLLEAIAVCCGFNAEGGTKNMRFDTRQSHSPLHQHLRVARGVERPKDGFFLRAESFFNVATEIERLDSEPAAGRFIIDSYGGRSLHKQSHGESSLALMLNRFGGQGLYILDEPEAALSPQRQMSALVRMHDLVNDQSQFIVATHSPILMAYPDAYIYSFSSAGIHRMDYYDTARKLFPTDQSKLPATQRRCDRFKKGCNGPIAPPIDANATATHSTQLRSAQNSSRRPKSRSWLILQKPNNADRYGRFSPR